MDFRNSQKKFQRKPLIVNFQKVSGLKFEVKLEQSKPTFHGKNKQSLETIESFPDSPFGTFVSTQVRSYKKTKTHKIDPSLKRNAETPFPNFIVLHMDSNILLVYRCDQINSTSKKDKLQVMSRVVEIWDEDEVNKIIERKGFIKDYLYEVQQTQCRGRKLRRHMNRNMGEVRQSIKNLIRYNYNSNPASGYVRMNKAETDRRLKANVGSNLLPATNLGINNYKPDQEVVYGLCIQLAMNVADVYNCLIGYYSKFNSDN